MIWIVELIHCLREEAPNQIQNILRNQSLPKLKRLYSQDCRPRRTVRERPWVLFHSVFPEKDIVSRLKHPDVASKRFRIITGSDGDVVCDGDATDYRVNMADLVKQLLTVAAEERLEVMDDSLDPEILRRKIIAWSATGDETIDGPMIALALPVWFREVVPYRPTYRSA